MIFKIKLSKTKRLFWRVSDYKNIYYREIHFGGEKGETKYDRSASSRGFDVTGIFINKHESFHRYAKEEERDTS